MQVFALSDDDLLLVNNALNEVLNGPGAMTSGNFNYGLGLNANALSIFSHASVAFLKGKGVTNVLLTTRPTRSL